MNAKTELYLRNIIFGISDSLVSTVGLLSGLGVTGATREIIVLTGIVYAFVEAFSMAVGSFFSERSAEEYERQGQPTDGKPFLAGVVMFVTFVVASFIPIVPYLTLSLGNALWVSIIVSIVALFILGLVSAKVTKVKMLRRATQMAVLGAAAIVIGVIVGRFVKSS